MAITQKYVVEMTPHQLQTWQGKTPELLSGTSVEVLRLWKERSEKLETLIKRSKEASKDSIISQLIEQQEDERFQAPMLDTAMVAWRQSSKQNGATIFPACPVSVIYEKLPEKKGVLTMDFVNVGFAEARPFENSSIYLEAQELLKNDPDDESEFEIIIHQSNDLTKRGFTETYTTLGKSLIKSIDKPRRVTSCIGQESTYTLCFEIEDAVVSGGGFIDPLKDE